jgi:hypothetical protein
MARQSRRAERQAFWLEHLRACANGTLKEYAAAHGLDLRALYDAKARLKRQGLLTAAPARLVRVERAESSAGSAALCRVHLRNGTAVEVACAPQHWPALLASVAALP